MTAGSQCHSGSTACPRTEHGGVRIISCFCKQTGRISACVLPAKKLKIKVSKKRKKAGICGVREVSLRAIFLGRMKFDEVHTM
jgi:hypothetical protein